MLQIHLDNWIGLAVARLSAAHFSRSSERFRLVFVYQ